MRIAQADGVKGSEETLKRKGRTKLGCWMMGCATPIGLIVLVGIGYFIWRARTFAAVSQIEAEIVERGEPINADELNAQYRDLKGAEDKTALFLAMFAKLEEKISQADQMPLPIVGIGEDFDLDPKIPFPQEQAVDDFLTRHSDLLDEIEAAALAEGEVRFPRDFREGPLMKTPEIESMRECTRLIDLRSRFAARTGDSDQAFRSVRAMIGLSKALRAEPMILSQLLRMAIYGVAVSALAETLSFTDWSEPQLAQLTEDCQSQDWHEAMKYALIGERAVGRVVFDQPEAAPNYVVEYFYPSRPEDERFYLRFTTDSVKATDLEFPEAVAELKKLDRALEAEFGNSSPVAEFTHFNSLYYVPLVEAASVAFAWAETNRRAGAAQLAIELYRRHHGKPPATLQDLVPQYLAEEPADPFTGKPLLYRFDGEEILVYSVSANGVDDGGVMGESSPPLDYPVRVPRK